MNEPPESFRCLMRHFGEVLKERRRARNLSLPGLAAKAAMSKGLISELEHGHGNPTIVTICRLCRALGCSPEYLVGAAEARVRIEQGDNSTP